MRVRIPVATVALTVLAFVVVLYASVRLYTVHGDSMEPTVSSGQIVLVNRLAFVTRPPRTGDVVVVEHPLHPGALVVKRLAGAQDGRFFLRGDNPSHSIDSRHYGTVPESRIHGRVVFIGP